MFGMKRYTQELAAGLAGKGIQVRLRGSRPHELRLGSLRVGGLVTEALRTWVPAVSRGLVHATDHNSNPRLPPADVVTVHDLIPSQRPDLSPSPSLTRRDGAAARRAVRTARRILTDTTCVAQELVHALGASPDQVRPVPLGVRHDVFHPDPTPLPGSPLRAGRLNVLVVANVERRKRLDLVARAASELPFVHLLHAGGAGRPSGPADVRARTEAALAPLRAEGRLAELGALDDAALRRLYAQADVVVHPTEAEGFGLPPLEALACGARVVASAIAPLREVLGDAVRYAAPDLDSLRRTLESCWDGVAVREQRFPPREARLRHARAFTWARTVERTLDVYDEAEAA
jgi:glycosyltransferase involved in cell wall biosynthesis